LNFLEKRLREKLEDITGVILQGNALDYAAYASAVARYRVLKELLDDLADHRKELSTGETESDD
jgi:hypothetical protein